MRRIIAILGASTLALPAAAPAATPQRAASVLTSNTHAGAKPVALTVTLTFEMKCGNPGKTPLSLTLPSAMTVPATISPRAVLLNGRAAKSVAVHGRTLVIAIEQSHFLNCNVVGFSTLRVVIAKSAGLGNPKAAGIYSFPLAIGAIRGAPQLRIT